MPTEETPSGSLRSGRGEVSTEQRMGRYENEEEEVLPVGHGCHLRRHDDVGGGGGLLF